MRERPFTSRLFGSANGFGRMRRGDFHKQGFPIKTGSHSDPDKVGTEGEKNVIELNPDDAPTDDESNR